MCTGVPVLLACRSPLSLQLPAGCPSSRGPARSQCCAGPLMRLRASASSSATEAARAMGTSSTRRRSARSTAGLLHWQVRHCSVSGAGAASGRALPAHLVCSRLHPGALGLPAAGVGLSWVQSSDGPRKRSSIYRQHHTWGMCV